MLASLSYYWKANLAVVAAVAVACAVLTGSLVVGDSVRGSLRDLTLDRLGEIDAVFLGEGFFRELLAADLESAATVERGLVAVPSIVLRGSAVVPELGSRASGINIYGVDQKLGQLFPSAPPVAFDFTRAEGQFLPSLVINESLRSELGADVGTELVLRLARPSDVPRESLLGSTEAGDLIQTLRLVVRAVIPDRGLGRLGLAPSQSLPLNAYVDLAELQRALDQRGRVNAVWLAEPGGSGDGLEAAVRAQIELDDIGLQLRVVGGSDPVVEVTSRDILIRPPLEAAVEAAGDDAGARILEVSTYLANRTTVRTAALTTVAGGSSALAYSTISALDLPLPTGLGELRLEDGAAAPGLADDQVLVNRWAADDLGARVGDRLLVDYWQVEEHERLVAAEVELTVAGIVAIAGLGADPTLTPPFPGIADADNMSDWEPTFPVDLSRIGARDEDYWDRYRATPKLFVSLALGRRLWGGRFGDLTAIRLAPSDGDAQALADRLAIDLPRRIALPAAGLSVIRLRDQGLRAAGGATDFAGLFAGFSLFLIAAAVMLSTLFFRLGVERRAKEIGTRLAIGFTISRVRAILIVEGAVLAVVGSAVGLGIALVYAGGMMLGLRTLWIGAVGTGFLQLHVEPGSLAIGFGVSVLVVILAIAWAVRALARAPVTSLLRGRVATAGSAAAGLGRDPRRGARTIVVALAIAVLLFAASWWTPPPAAPPLFLALGAALLVAGAAVFGRWLAGRGGHPIDRPGWLSILRLATANAAVNPGRSRLSVALVAAATFVIVAVGAYGHRFGDELERQDSGAGGFTLIAESDVPVFHDLDDPAGRQELGISTEAEQLLEGATVMSLRVLPGDDVSCLNLYQPERPRLLGVPDRLIERGGFQFQQVAGARDEPWRLLSEPLGDGAIPAIGDFNSVSWILKSGLGKDVVITDERGEPLRLRIVGLLRRSVFQSELLISEAHLLEHFPSRSGYSFFLVDPESGTDQATASALEESLSRFGLDVSTAAQRLASYQAVENTYLGTFQLLGGLGLLLGTIGLAVVLLRNVLDRVAELATLRAIGFRLRTLGASVVAESLVSLIAGIAIGAAAGLVAVAPHLRGGQALVPWVSLGATLALVAAVGTLACALAVRQALRTPLLPSLRSE